MTYEAVTATNWPKTSIYDFAEKIVTTLNYHPADPLEDVITSLGGTIVYQNLFEIEKTNDGSIQVEADGSFKIFLPDYVSVERNRFTMAHELGHYALHRVDGKPWKAARLIKVDASNKRVEWEANWFAAGFLMPKTAFLKKYAELAGRPVALARYFRVSVQSAEIQAKNYGKTP